MKLPMILIIAGVALLAYWGWDYSQNTETAGIAGVELTVSKDTSPIPAILGGIALVAGVVMTVSGKKRS